MAVKSHYKHYTTCGINTSFRVFNRKRQDIVKNCGENLPAGKDLKILPSFQRTPEIQALCIVPVA